MELWRIGFLKYLLLIAHFGLCERVAGEEDLGGNYNVVIDETVESRLWNATDYKVEVHHNNSIESVHLCEDNPCKNDGLCRLENGQLKCTCIGPYAGEYCEKDCDCGDAVCELDEKGNKTECNCTENQILYEGKCVDCDCGDAVCELDGTGNKTECNCTENQILFEGKCVDCDCGDAVCELDETGNKKECNCTGKQLMYRGICVDCDCGNATCKLDVWGRKHCICPKKQIFNKGNCEECDCGERSKRCFINNKDKKQCECLPGAAELRGLCIDCSCGVNSTSCLFNERGKKICSCKKGSSPKNSTCIENCKYSSDCLNRGTCKYEDGGYFCKCRSGFSGAKCQIDDVCESMRAKCDAMRAVCEREGLTRGRCVCPKGKTYRWTTGKCEDICKASTCNHGYCIVTGNDYICMCKSGFKGPYCNEIMKPINDKINVTYEVIVPVILSIVIVFFIIATIFLILKNRRLTRNSGQTSVIN